MATEEAGLIEEGIRQVKNFLKSFKDVGGTQSTLLYIKVCSSTYLKWQLKDAPMFLSLT
jgi:hypothetical protein